MKSSTWSNSAWDECWLWKGNRSSQAQIRKEEYSLKDFSVLQDLALTVISLVKENSTQSEVNHGVFFGQGSLSREKDRWESGKEGGEKERQKWMEYHFFVRKNEEKKTTANLGANENKKKKKVNRGGCSFTEPTHTWAPQWRPIAAIANQQSPCNEQCAYSLADN